MKKKHLLSSFLVASMLCTNAIPAEAEVSGSTIHLLLYDQNMSAEMNGTAEPLDAPALVADGSFYVPIRWVADKLGLKLSWDAERRIAGLTTSKAYVQWDLEHGLAFVNGNAVPLEETAVIWEGRLLVKLRWIAPYLDVKYKFQPDPSRVELIYVQKPDSAYRESVYPEDTQPNSRPIAKFMTDKAVYKIGEPVGYIDLSYDPDAEGLPHYQWTGKQEAFFEPGEYKVTLQVSDGKGRTSEPFTKTVTVINETFLTKSEYPWYTKPVGSMINDASDAWKEKLADAPQLSAIVKRMEDRQRIVSGENQTIQHTGMIGQAYLNGKARFFSHHINGSNEKIRFAAAVRNPSKESKLIVRLTREGVLGPTLFDRFVGGEAGTDFLTRTPSEREIEVEPGKTVVLYDWIMEPGQGFVSINDIETSGPSDIGFVAMKPEEGILQAASYFDHPASAAATTSSYATSDVRLDADADKTSLRNLSKWTVGGEAGIGAAAASDRGTVYSLHLYHPRKAVIALQAKEGYLNGSLKVNGSMVSLPRGGLTDRDGSLLVYRSEGSESSVDIEWIAAPGSQSPLEWIFYPLEDK